MLLIIFNHLYVTDHKTKKLKKNKSHLLIRSCLLNFLHPFVKRKVKKAQKGLLTTVGPHLKLIDVVRLYTLSAGQGSPAKIIHDSPSSSFFPPASSAALALKLPADNDVVSLYLMQIEVPVAHVFPPGPFGTSGEQRLIMYDIFSSTESSVHDCHVLKINKNFDLYYILKILLIN